MPEETKPRCTCAQCRLSGIRGPVLLITIGVLFLIGEYTRYGFGDLWPVLLIVLGVMAVLQAFATRQGHTGS